jgi:hypothetical protein
MQDVKRMARLRGGFASSLSAQAKRLNAAKMMEGANSGKYCGASLVNDTLDANLIQAETL